MAKDKGTWCSQKVKGCFLTDRKNQEIESEFNAQAPDGFYVITKSRQIPKKTWKQVKTIFGHLIKNSIIQAKDNGIDTAVFLHKILDPTIGNGIELDEDFLYYFLLKACPQFDSEHKIISLSKMDISQGNKFFKQCQSLLAKAGIDISDPDKDWDKEKK